MTIKQREVLKLQCINEQIMSLTTAFKRQQAIVQRLIKNDPSVVSDKQTKNLKSVYS